MLVPQDFINKVKENLEYVCFECTEDSNAAKTKKAKRYILKMSKYCHFCNCKKFFMRDTA